MDRLQTVDADDLRIWLSLVDNPRTIRSLMAAIAHLEGVDIEDLASWYNIGETDLDQMFAQLEREPLTVVLARLEGVDFDALAAASGLTLDTIVEWFARLDDEPIERAADIIGRYATRQVRPLVSTTESRVHYLDYETVVRHDWELDDPELFDHAATADLAPEEYGRILVEPGQTILEAAEARGMSWPYACRGGACANCAVIVLEGDVAMPGQTVLTDEQVRSFNARLTCVGVPVSERVRLVKNVQTLDAFEGLRLPSPMGATGE
ncbi:MAG: ferredoxin Fer [Halobacteriota archaeon]